MISISQIHVK